MRRIARVDSETDARALGDALTARGIANEVESDGSGAWTVWGHDDARLDEARGLHDDVREGRQIAPPKATAQAAEDVREQRRRLDEAHRANAIHIQARWHNDAFLSARVGRVTAALIVACIGVAMLSRLGDNIEPIEGLFIQTFRVVYRGDAALPSFPIGLTAVARGQVWRLVTPAFIHFGLIHLLFNMMWLKDLGSTIERGRGWPFLLGFVAASAGASNLVQYAWAGPYFGGMSGVVYALLGYLWMRGRFDPGSGLSVDPRHVVWMGVWLVLCMTGIIPQVANAAHLAGLLVGAAWGFLESGELARRLK